MSTSPSSHSDHSRDPDTTRRELTERIQHIVDAPRPVITAEQVARDKRVLAECRYLMRLLATRRRSRAEMMQRLQEREVAPSEIHEVMARIERAELVDDATFAREWVRQRRERRGLSHDALRRELEGKGVHSQHIDAALDLEEKTEEDLCRELVRTRLASEARALRGLPSGGPEWSKVARRLEGYVRRRGYSGALVTHVISTEMRAATGH